MYGGRVPPGPRELRAGEKLFLGNCSGCHPYGGNIVDADAPVRGAPSLKSDEAFIRWIRDPRLDNGARGVMPPFVPSRISDAQAVELRRYLLNVTGARDAGFGVRERNSPYRRTGGACILSKKEDSSSRRTVPVVTQPTARSELWDRG